MPDDSYPKTSEIDKELRVFKCPACGKSKDEEFSECPYCGIIVSKYLSKKAKEKKGIRDDQNELIHNNTFNKKKNNTPIKRVITINLIFRWIFGVLFLLAGLASLYNSPLSGLMMLLMSAVLLPPIINKLENKLKIELSRNVKALILLTCFFGIGIVESAKDQKQENINKVAQKKLTQDMQEKKQKRQRIEIQKKEVEYKLRRIERERKQAEELQKANKDASTFKQSLYDLLSKQNLQIVQDVYINQNVPQEITIVMKPMWHVRNKHLRKNDATVFWKLWASIHSPENPDHARIKLVSIELL